MSAIVKPRPLCPAEFLEWENRQEARHELLDGEIVAMTGGTVAHATLIPHLGSALFGHLHGTRADDDAVAQIGGCTRLLGVEIPNPA